MLRQNVHVGRGRPLCRRIMFRKRTIVSWPSRQQYSTRDQTLHSVLIQLHYVPRSQHTPDVRTVCCL